MTVVGASVSTRKNIVSKASQAENTNNQNDLCIRRLAVERKQWTRDHPHGFAARPYIHKTVDGEKPNSADMMVWECLIPGKRNTIWDGGFYRVVLKFSAKYPLEPPHAKFVPRLLHPNVYPTGTICSNLLTNQGWRPALTIKQLLLAFQNLLDEPNLSSPAQSEAFKLITQNPKEYNLRVKRLAQQYNAPVMPIGLPLDNESAKSNK